MNENKRKKRGIESFMKKSSIAPKPIGRGEGKIIFVVD
jgi:hypothetical protein